MKKFYILMLLCIFGIGLVQAQQNYTVTTSDYTSIQMTLTAPVPTVGVTNYMDVEYNVLQMPGFAETHTIGEPSLPQFGHMLEIPLCDGVTVKAENAVFETIDGATLGLTHMIMPTQLPRNKSDRSPLTLTMNNTTYTTDALYGEQLVTVEPIGIARNQNLAVLHFSPVQYNPVTNQIVVCRSVNVTINYVNADREATEEMQELHYSPAFAAAATMNTLPRKEAAYQGAPIRMLVVAGSTFSGDADLTSYINWKKRKGYLIDVVYTSDANVGTTTTTIAAYIKSQYTNATAENPAPTFVLLVGDAATTVTSNATPAGALIPAFSTQVTGELMSGNTNEHPTDLYYFTWTSGDNIPDCYYGRFSARTTTDLKNIIEKTLTYEQYSFTDPSYLNRSVIMAGVDQGSTSDNGYKYADPTQDYVVMHYVNGDSPYPFSSVNYYKNRNSRNPGGASSAPTNVTIASNGGSSCSQSSAIRTLYNNGCGWINYSAHGDTNMWYCPQLTSTQVGSMTNNGKYGVMIGNCCLTNTFTRPSCYGETLLRKAKAGAVAYIGASDYSYWDADFWWSVGYRSSISYTMGLDYNSTYPGSYDLMCHTNGEAQNTWHTSLGAMVTAGNNAVTTGSNAGTGYYNYTLYYWEIYHIMGDPSITPWLTTPDDMTLSVASTITAGTTSLEVTAVPYAYVAMTTGNGEYNFVAAAFANASGVATLTLPNNLAIGTYEVTASAQQYKTAFANVQVIVPSGPYVTGNSLTEDNALNVGQSATYTLELENVGTATANNITINFTSNNDHVTVTNGNTSVATLNAGATQTLSSVFSVQADASCTDQMPVTLTATISWTGCETPAVVRLNTVVNAPMPVVTYTWNPTQVAPGGNAVCNVTMTNNGHMAMDNVTMTFTEDFPLVEVTGGANTFNLAIGGTVNYSYTATVDAQMPNNVTVPFNLNVANDNYNYSEELRLLVSGSVTGDNFDDGNVDGWTGGTYPWIATNDQYHSAGYSMKSANNLGRNKTSEMSYTYSSDQTDSIRFYYKVSSEENYDKFYFYIDGVEQTLPAGNSGEVDWTYAAYAVAAGSHTYKFSYVKDYSTTAGSDCAWVDDVVFPINATDLIASRTDQVCQNGSYSLNGATVNTSTVGTQYLLETLTTTTGNLVELNVVGTIESAPITMEACSNYEWNGTNYNTSGTYTYTSTSVAGCDSVATLNLTILPNYTITFSANGGNGTMAPQQACSGQTVTLNANSFTNGTSVFTGWATTAGGSVVYANGADVTVTGNMTLYAVWYTPCSNQTATVTVANCDSYNWYGTEYTTSGTYTHTVTNAVEGGCDSIYTLNLTINQSVSSTVNETACDSYTWSANGQTYTTSGTYTYNGTTAQGCANNQTLVLIIEQSGTSTVNETACDSYYWSVNGQTYTTGGTYTYNGTTAAGCVVSQTLHLTINQSTSSTETQQACDSYVWNGTTYTTSGTYTIDGTNAQGCPDVQTLNLTINQSVSSTVSETACDSYTWSANGQTYTTSGTYTYNGTTAQGCSDMQTLNLTVNQSTNLTASETACQSYTWNVNGQTYTTSGTYTFNGTNAAGCPETQTLYLTVNQPTSSSETQQACDSYTWYGEVYTTSGTYTHTTTGVNGCDNTVTLYLTIGHSTSSTDVVEACDSYTWRNGNTYTASTNQPTINSTNSDGCPETVTLNLTIHYSTITRLNDEVNAGEIYSGNGFFEPAIDEPGLYHDTMSFQTIYGCDSTVILNLIVLESSGIDDIDNISMSVYPNPTAGMVTISLDGIADFSIEIYDIYGRRLDRQDEVGSVATVDLGSYASGVYFARIYQSSKLLATTKVVRQ